MAKETVVVTRDDWTGEVVDPTDIAPKQITTFVFNGREYALDLSMASANELHATLAPWMDKASHVNVTGRRTSHTRAGTGTSTTHSSEREERSHIREWARDNGFEIGPRGRISDTIMRAYQHRNDDSIASEDAPLASAPEASSTSSPVTEMAAEPEPTTEDRKPSAQERAAIRQWALDQGREVKNRGPLSPELVRDYRESQAA